MSSNSNNNLMGKVEEPEQLSLFREIEKELNYEKKIDTESDRLYHEYEHLIRTSHTLSRSLVSYQGNKEQQFYRWFKFKEGFSHAFVKQVINEYTKEKKPEAVLDPFAGIGTTVTTSAQMGVKAKGIELLPVGLKAIKARLISTNLDLKKLEDYIYDLKKVNFQDSEVESRFYFNHLTITQHAFPQNTELALAHFRKFLQSIPDDEIRELFEFAGMAILEDISYTRKDGQYLRWDSRANRQLKSKFSKGKIYGFEEKLFEKLETFYQDLNKSDQRVIEPGLTEVFQGSSLHKMAELTPKSIDLIITSPPYCNRYDYTRTYALELAYLGLNETDMKALRQSLLSATVENKTKVQELLTYYKKIGREEWFEKALHSFYNQKALHEKLDLLKAQINRLNNKKLPEMIYNYFLEMTIVIFEMARVLTAGGKVYMVNDNVQYNGEEIPVDLIMSDIAEMAGLKTEAILTLPRGKGNSSQQMKGNGRHELRKCVYIWANP